MTFVASGVNGLFATPEGNALAGIAISVIHNPLQVLIVHKQAIQREGQILSYRDIVKQSNMGKLFTLGLIPSIIRNAFLSVAFLPTMMGYTYEPAVAIYCLGAIVLSHPFEVARTIIQYAGTGTTRKVLG